MEALGNRTGKSISRQMMSVDEVEVEGKRLRVPP